MLVSSRHLTPKLWFIGNARGTRASSPKGSQCSQYTVLGVHGASMPAEGLCLPHLHPLPSAPGSLEVLGCLLPPQASLPLPPATGFLFKDDSGGSSQYFGLLAAAAASSLIINCLGWVAPWFSPIPVVSPLITHQNKPFKEEKKNGKGYFRQGQGQWVPLCSTGSQIREKLPAAKRNPPGHSRDLGGKSRLQWPRTWEHSSGEGCWKPSLPFRCEAIRVGV